MDKETLIKYSPAVVVVIALIFQWNLFVTPEKLEIAHREIVTEIAQNFVSKAEYDSQKEDIKDMKNKLDKIYDFIFLGKK